MIIHSTCTNGLTRRWLDRIRADEANLPRASRQYPVRTLTPRVAERTCAAVHADTALDRRLLAGLARDVLARAAQDLPELDFGLSAEGGRLVRADTHRVPVTAETQ